MSIEGKFKKRQRTEVLERLSVILCTFFSSSLAANSYSPYQAQVSYNGFEGVCSTCNDVGFRCVVDAR